MINSKGVFGKCVSNILAFTVVLLTLHPTTGYTQSTEDRQLPVISHTAVTEPETSSTVVFRARVSDNVGVKSVSLLSRFGGEQVYKETEMRQMGSDGIYQAEVRVTGLEKQQIEYFIIAEDTSGNSVLEGFAFDPLIRLLAPSSADFSTTTQSPSSVTPAKKINKWYYVLGAVAVIALGVAANGGGGGGNGNECSDTGTGCVVDIEVPTPTP